MHKVSFTYQKRFVVLEEGGLECAAMNSKGEIVITGGGRIVFIDFDGEKASSEYIFKT